MMTDRIKKLRQQSLDAINTLSSERAELLTEFFSSAEARDVSVPVRRALAFKYLMEHKTICINDGELILGERGPAPKATPTYPEVCLHSLEDLQILNDRPKVSFLSDEMTRNAFRDKIIPFWKNNTHRDRLMDSMEKEWLDAYAAGVFTEFQEQRAPGHTVLGDRIYRKGMLDMVMDIDEQLARLHENEVEEDRAKGEELRAMKICAMAIIRFAERHAEALEKLTRCPVNSVESFERREEILRLARICRKVPAYAPETFHEALQYYWFVHVGVITELNPWDSFNPGRLDQHLYPFYQKETAEGKLTTREARELLQAFWVKFNNHPAPPKIGVTAKESSTYTDFSLINVGGLKPDGSNAVNELSFLILDVVEEMRILQPSSMIQVSRENPDEFVKRAAKIIRTGFGQPSVFNTDAIVEELTRQGKTLGDALAGGASGCVESGAFGKEAYWLTGYFNLPKILEITLNNGFDNRTNKQIGPKTGAPASFDTFEQLLEAFNIQLRHFIDIKIRGNLVIEKLFAKHLPVPFLSLLIDDCIINGRDYNAGGARYNTSYIQGVGLGSVTDMLTALKYWIFDKGTGGPGDKGTRGQGDQGTGYAMGELLEAMKANFEGYEELRYRLVYETPKFGNDDDYADAQAVAVFEMFFDAVEGRPNTRGGKHHIMMLPTTSHVYFGSVTGAMPDGRKAWQPLSEGISPFQGADTKGPTAVIKSAAKIRHLYTGGTLLNQKFTPQLLADEKGLDAMTALIRSYFSLSGHHIQFNVVTAATLRDAQKHPENHRDLIVRVAGYSDYFNDLGPELQDEIIRRTEQSGF
jgi:formate C-acetyltransferase